MKKRLTALLLCTAMIAAVSGCGKKDGNNADATEVTASADIEYEAADYVTLGDYLNLKITMDEEYIVTDADVQEYIEKNIMEVYPNYKDTDKTTVEEGDFVNIDYEGTEDGVAFAGGTNAGYVLEIGGGGFIEGFEDGLIGANVGDVKELNLTFPEDYRNSEMAGKEVVFKVTVNKIVEADELTYDTLTDEYVTTMAGQTGMSCTTVDELKEDVRSYLETVASSSMQNVLSSAVMDKLTEICPVKELPKGLLAARKAEVIAQYENSYVKDDSTLEEYVTETLKQDYEEFMAQMEEDVKNDLKLQIVLEAIADKEGIELDEEGFEAYLDNLMSGTGMTDKPSLYEYYGGSEAAGEKYLKKVYVCTLALQKVVENAEVTFQDADADTEEGTESLDGTEEETENADTTEE